MAKLNKKPAGRKEMCFVGSLSKHHEADYRCMGFFPSDKNLVTDTHGLHNNLLRQVLQLSLGLSSTRFYFLDQFYVHSKIE